MQLNYVNVRVEEWSNAIYRRLSDKEGLEK